MPRRLIATGETDRNGVFTLNYTGVGAGELNLVAEHTSGTTTITSELYTFYDCLIADTGVDPGYTDIWLVNADTTLTRGSDYSTISEAGSTSALLRLASGSNVDANGTIMFDFYQVDGTSALTPFFLRSKTGGTNVGSFKLSDLNENIEEWVRIKIVFNKTKATVYSKNTPNGYEITLSTEYDAYGFAFSTPGTMTTLRFKNFMIY